MDVNDANLKQVESDKKQTTCIQCQKDNTNNDNFKCYCHEVIKKDNKLKKKLNIMKNMTKKHFSKSYETVDGNEEGKRRNSGMKSLIQIKTEIQGITYYISTR